MQHTLHNQSFQSQKSFFFSLTTAGDGKKILEKTCQKSSKWKIKLQVEISFSIHCGSEDNSCCISSLRPLFLQPVAKSRTLRAQGKLSHPQEFFWVRAAKITHVNRGPASTVSRLKKTLSICWNPDTAYSQYHNVGLTMRAPTPCTYLKEVQEWLLSLLLWPARPLLLPLPPRGQTMVVAPGL